MTTLQRTRPQVFPEESTCVCVCLFVYTFKNILAAHICVYFFDVIVYEKTNVLKNGKKNQQVISIYR